MDVIFFKTNVAFVNEKLSIADCSCCAFWYSPGLTSYIAIDDILEISNIYLEKSIAATFKRDYHELTERYHIIYFGESNENLVKNTDIALLASNDTIIHSFKNIIRCNHTFAFGLFCKKGESAQSAASRLGIESIEIDQRIPFVKKYALLLMGNDWGKFEQKINWDFINKGKNTICVQESIIDFGAADQKMLHCSFPIYMGTATLKCVELNKKICAVIGNPRYENLKYTPLPAKKKVLLNVNFTYGIYEEERQQWVDDIVNICGSLNLDYLISQHPRDQGDLSNYNVQRTNAGSVHDLIINSTILITRFSSLIHESLCLGRPVIYYNPHREALFYDFEPDNKSLIYAYNTSELQTAIITLTTINTSDQIENPMLPYLKRHLGITNEGKASGYILDLMNDAVHFQPLRKRDLAKSRLLKYQLFQLRYWKFKNKLKSILKHKG